MDVEAKVLPISRMYALFDQRYVPRGTNLVVIVCNGPEKCVFVRVVDSCAGCAKGSSHVDLTKAAFSHLANLDTGVLQVEMRPATEPADW
jgi:expansin (peptidoglycan-binding protein)